MKTKLSLTLEVNRDSALFNQRTEGVVSATNKKGAVPIYLIPTSRDENSLDSNTLKK